MKKIICILIFAIILSTSISWGFDKSDMPNMIKIGLKYGSNSVYQTNIQSTSGFEFGIYDDDEFNCLLNLEGFTNITLKKDEYYKVQIGNIFTNKEDMESFLDSLDHQSYYPVYDNGWKVCTGLFDSYEEAREFMTSNGRISDKKTQVVNPNNVSVAALDKSGRAILAYNSFEKEYNFRPFIGEQGNDIIAIDGKKYRGGIIIKRYPNSDITVINCLDLDEYLYGVVPKEMSGEWPMEALKAQAVAARSYAISTLHKHEDLGFNLCTTNNCQVYQGYDAEKPRSNMAVDQTSGEVLTYDGEVITPFYHSSSGGYTEDSENVWSAELPYIRGVKDEFSLEAPNSNWTKSYTKEEIKNILNSAGFDIGDIKAIYPSGRTDSGRLISLNISDGSKEISLEKGKARNIFGATVIKSMNFDVITDGAYCIKSSDMDKITRKSMSSVVILSSDKSVKTSPDKRYQVFNGNDYTTSSGASAKYTFRGTGYGHGLGMSQWGAKKMAELGYVYEDILKHYYTGITIE